MAHRALLVLLLASLGVLGGCGGGYVIRGRVIAGDFTALAFVPADDPRLEDPSGVANAEITIHRDPLKPNRALAGRTLSGADGSIHLPVEGFGAGWMVEQWQIAARRAGYGTAEAHVTLPRSSKDSRLLVILAPGHGGSISEPEDLMEQYRRFR